MIRFSQFSRWNKILRLIFTRYFCTDYSLPRVLIQEFLFLKSENSYFQWNKYFFTFCLHTAECNNFFSFNNNIFLWETPFRPLTTLTLTMIFSYWMCTMKFNWIKGKQSQKNIDSFVYASVQFVFLRALSVREKMLKWWKRKCYLDGYLRMRENVG